MDGNSPEAWKATTAPDGRVYYYNKVTKETSWDAPPGVQPAPPARNENSNSGGESPGPTQIMSPRTQNQQAAALAAALMRGAPSARGGPRGRGRGAPARGNSARGKAGRASPGARGAMMQRRGSNGPAGVRGRGGAMRGRGAPPVRGGRGAAPPPRRIAPVSPRRNTDSTQLSASPREAANAVQPDTSDAPAPRRNTLASEADLLAPEMDMLAPSVLSPRTQYAQIPNRPDDIKKLSAVHGRASYDNGPPKAVEETHYAGIPQSVQDAAAAEAAAEAKLAALAAESPATGNDTAASSAPAAVTALTSTDSPERSALNTVDTGAAAGAAPTSASGTEAPTSGSSNAAANAASDEAGPPLGRVESNTELPGRLERTRAKRVVSERRVYPFDDAEESDLIMFETDADEAILSPRKGKKKKKAAAAAAAAAQAALLSPRGNEQLKAATLEKLVERLTSATVVPDTQFLRDFLSSFLSFAESKKLLELLMLRYEVPIPTELASTMDENAMESFIKQKRIPIRLRVVNVLNTWIERHWDDFAADAKLLHTLRHFVEDKIAVTMPSTGVALQDALKKKESGAERFKPTMFAQEPPTPEAPESISEEEMSTWSHLDVKPLEIARQLTLIEFDLFRQIKPREFLNQAWTRKDKHERAPNILRFIDRFNRVSQWVASCICSERDSERRIALINHFVEVALHLKKLNNFNGVMELLSGMASSSVYRLRQTWAALEERRQTQLEILQEMCASSENYKILRAYLRQLQPPSIPYLGVFLTDLMFIDTGIKDNVENANGVKLIHFTKARKVASVIALVQRSQETPYSLLSLPYMQRLLTELKINTEDENYKLSLEIEPRKRAQQTAAPVVEQVERTESAAPLSSSLPAATTNSSAATSAAAAATLSPRRSGGGGAQKKPKICEECKEGKVAAIVKASPKDGGPARQLYLCKQCTIKLQEDHAEHVRQQREQEEVERRAQQEAEAAVRRRESIAISSPQQLQEMLAAEAERVERESQPWMCATCSATNAPADDQCMTCGTMQPAQTLGATELLNTAAVMSPRATGDADASLNASGFASKAGTVAPPAAAAVAPASPPRDDKTMPRSFEAKDVYTIVGAVFMAEGSDLHLRMIGGKGKKFGTVKAAVLRLRVPPFETEGWADALATCGAVRAASLENSEPMPPTQASTGRGETLFHGLVERLESKRFGSGDTVTKRYAALRSDGALMLGGVPDDIKKRGRHAGGRTASLSDTSAAPTAVSAANAAADADALSATAAPLAEAANAERGANGRPKKRRQFFGLKLGGGTVQREMRWDDRLRDAKSQYRMKVNFALPGLADPVMLPLEPDVQSQSIIADLYQIFTEQLAPISKQPEELCLLVAPMAQATTPPPVAPTAKLSTFYFSEQYLLAVVPLPVGVYQVQRVHEQESAPVGMSMAPRLALCEHLRFLRAVCGEARFDFALQWASDAKQQWLPLTRSLEELGLGNEQAAKAGTLRVVSHADITLAARHIRPSLAGRLVQVRRKRAGGQLDTALVVPPSAQQQQHAQAPSPVQGPQPMWCRLHDQFISFAAGPRAAPQSMLNLSFYAMRIIQTDGGNELVLERREPQTNVLPEVALPKRFVFRLAPNDTSSPPLSAWLSALESAGAQEAPLPCTIPLEKAYVDAPPALSPRGAKSPRGVVKPKAVPQNAAGAQLAQLGMAAVLQQKEKSRRVVPKEEAAPKSEVVAPKAKPTPVVGIGPGAVATPAAPAATTAPSQAQASGDGNYSELPTTAVPGLVSSTPTPVDVAFDLVRKSWYYRGVTRQEAIDRLEGATAKPGDFVVRPSSKEACFALTFRKKAGVAHSLLRYRTKNSGACGWSIEQEETLHPTLDILLQSYPGIIFKEARSDIVFGPVGGVTAPAVAESNYGELTVKAPDTAEADTTPPQYTKVPQLELEAPSNALRDVSPYKSAQPLLPIAATAESVASDTSTVPAPPPGDADEEEEDEDEEDEDEDEEDENMPPLGHDMESLLRPEDDAGDADDARTESTFVPPPPEGDDDLSSSMGGGTATTEVRSQYAYLPVPAARTSAGSLLGMPNKQQAAPTYQVVPNAASAAAATNSSAGGLADSMDGAALARESSIYLSMGSTAMAGLVDELDNLDFGTNDGLAVNDATDAGADTDATEAAMGTGGVDVGDEEGAQPPPPPVEEEGGADVRASVSPVQRGDEVAGDADADADDLALALEDEGFLQRTCTRMRRDVLLAAARDIGGDGDSLCVQVCDDGVDLRLLGSRLVRWAMQQVDAVAGRKAVALRLLTRLQQRGALVGGNDDAFDSDAFYSVKVGRDESETAAKDKLDDLVSRAERRVFVLRERVHGDNEADCADESVLSVLEDAEVLLRVGEEAEVWNVCKAPLLDDIEGDSKSNMHTRRRLRHIYECVCALRVASGLMEEEAEEILLALVAEMEK